MTGIAQRLEADWDHLTATLRHQAAESSASSQPEVQPVTVSARLADAEKAVEALASHIKALASNPLIDALVEAGVGLVLTPGEIIAVRGFVAAIEAERTPAGAVVQAGEGVASAFQGAPAQVV